MGLPPNPATELADGMKTFASGASDVDIPTTLLLAFLAPFIVYNLAIVFDLDLATIINFGQSLYRFFIDWVNPKPTSSVNTSIIYDKLDRILYHSTPNTDQAITVEVIGIPGSGKVAIIDGLPDDLSTTDLSRFLRAMLYIHYQPQLQPHRDTASNTIRADPAVTEDAQIDTSGPGLWNDTCINNAPSNTSAASFSPPSTTHPTTLEDEQAAFEDTRAANEKDRATLELLKREGATVREELAAADERMLER